MKFKVQESIDNALLGKSKLVPDILALNGMSSVSNRHLLNNLLSNGGNYLEIGVWHGSTFISALYDNKVSAYAVDNWSEYNDNESKYNFYENCKRFGIGGFTFFEMDAFTINLNKIIDKINVFFYDGDHNYDQTRKSLNYFLPVLADEFLFIADDYDWQGVHKGVRDGIRDCNIKVRRKWILHSEDKHWWNGLGIFILKKNE